MKKRYPLGLVMSAVLLAGCSPAQAGPSAPAQGSQPAAAPAAASQAPAPKVSLPDGIVTKGVVTTPHGSYLQTSIADSDPVLSLNPSLVDPALKSEYSVADMQAANKFLARFLAEEGLDSSINGENDVDAWAAAHKDEIHSAAPADLVGSLKEQNGGFLYRIPADDPAVKPVYGADQVRITARNITPTRMESGTDPTGKIHYLQLDANFAIKERVVKNGKPAEIQVVGQAGYAAAKDTDGSWKLIGAQMRWNTQDDAAG